MDNSITTLPELTEAEKLLAHYPGTKKLSIPMTPTPAKGSEDKRYSSQHRRALVRAVV